MLCSDKAGADQLDQRLAEAEKVLGEYVGKLEAEEKERKDLQELLDVFVWQQRQQLRDSKKKLKVSVAILFQSSDLKPHLRWSELKQLE